MQGIEGLLVKGIITRGQAQATEGRPLGAPSADFLALCHAQLDVMGTALRCCGAQPTRITLYLRTPESFLSGQIELFRVVRRLPGARDMARYQSTQGEMGGGREDGGGEGGEVKGVSEEEEEEEEEVGNEPPIAKLPPSIEAVLVQKEVISLESEGALVVALTRDSFLLGLLVLHRQLLPLPPTDAPPPEAVSEKEAQRQESSVNGAKRDNPGDPGGHSRTRSSDGGGGVGGGGGGRGGRSGGGVGAVGRLQQWVLRRPERRGEGEIGRRGVREDEVESVESKRRVQSEGGGRQGRGEGTRERRSGEVGGEQANGGQEGGAQVEWVQLKPYEEEEQRAAVGVARSLAFAYVMEQRAWMMQQSLWQRTVTIDSLLDQMRAPLSALRTLGRMLMPQVAKTELGPDLVQGMVSQGDEIGDVLSQLQQALYPLPHPPGAPPATAAAASAQPFPTHSTTATTATTIPRQSILPPPPPHRTQLLLPPLADTELPMPPLLLPAPPAAEPAPSAASTPAANPHSLGAPSGALAAHQVARPQLFNSSHPTCCVHRVLLPLLDAATSLATACEIRFTVSYGRSNTRSCTEPAPTEPAAVPATSVPATAAMPVGAALGRVNGGRENWAEEGGGWVHVHWQRAPGGGVLLLVEDSGVGVHYLSASMAASTQNLPPGKLARAADAFAAMELARNVAEVVGAVMRVQSPHLINAPCGYGGTRVEIWLPSAPVSIQQ
ncbi:unnamed protein product [Closterium sp. Yama58-4]|nr:unnamed protein product [Closterium sp. Yama58-4]